MSLKLPPTTSPIRELFDITELVEIGAGRGELAPTFGDFLRHAEAITASDPAIVSLNGVCLMHTGELWLIEAGADRNDFKVIWNFGPCR